MIGCECGCDDAMRGIDDENDLQQIVAVLDSIDCVVVALEMRL